MAISPDLEPDHEAMHRHVQSLFGGASAWALGGLVELAWTDASPPHALSHAALFPLTELQALVEKAAALNRRPGSNVYIGAALRRPDVTGGKRCSDADFHAAPFAWADIDTDVVEAALTHCTTAGVPPTLTVITGTTPHKRAQLWWRLDSASVDPAAHRSLCATIGKALGGDPTVANPGRVMRLGGSVAWPVKLGRVPERTELHFAPSGPSEGHRPATLLERLGGPDLLVSRPAATTAAQMPPPPELPRPEPSLRPHDGLAIGSLSVESTLTAIRSGHRWHEHTLRLVKPRTGALYSENIAILPALDEIKLDDERPTLIILEQPADKLPQEFVDWWNKQDLQNRVLVLTADRNAVATLRTSGRSRRSRSGSRRSTARARHRWPN